MPDVIVTGLPRAGSAVVSALIDSLPDSVSLNAPLASMAVAHRTFEAMPYCKWLVGDFVWTRRALLNKEPIGDFRAADGKPLLDGLYDPRQKFKDTPIENSSETIKEPDLVYFFRDGLSKDFTLAMRHHTLFTSVLPTLVKFKHFKIIAVIRHPLDVLNSWMQLPKPALARGNPHGISRFWPEALEIMDSNIGMVDRYVQLYEAFIGRYHELREHIQIVKYEDVVENPDIISQMLGTPAGSADVSELIEKRARVRITSEAKIARESFRKYGVFTKLYYPDI